jgi:hypothetical protein
MRHPHQLFHSLQSLPSSQHPQRLPSLSYPSISLLLVKLVKHFRWMLPSYLQWSCHTYLALGGDKGTKLRIRLTRNGISGAFPIAQAHRKPLFLHRSFAGEAELESCSCFYDTSDDLERLLKSLAAGSLDTGHLYRGSWFSFEEGLRRFRRGLEVG